MYIYSRSAYHPRFYRLTSSLNASLAAHRIKGWIVTRFTEFHGPDNFKVALYISDPLQHFYYYTFRFEIIRSSSMVYNFDELCKLRHTSLVNFHSSTIRFNIFHHLKGRRKGYWQFHRETINPTCINARYVWQPVDLSLWIHLVSRLFILRPRIFRFECRRVGVTISSYPFLLPVWDHRWNWRPSRTRIASAEMFSLTE